MRLGHPDYPVFFRPTDAELVELARHRVDTLRVIEAEDDSFAIASGYGNTHHSMMQAIAKIEPRWWGVDYIVYPGGAGWCWNHLGHWGIKRDVVLHLLARKWAGTPLWLAVNEVIKMQEAL